MTTALLPLVALACTPGTDPAPADSAVPGSMQGGLPIRWVPTAGEPWDEALAGLWWSLAGLGASPSSDAIGDVSVDGSGMRFTLHADALGLSREAEHMLLEGISPIEIARVQQGMPYVELGRLLQRTLYEPWVYYAVTGACRELEDWEVRLPHGAPTVAITDSLLTDGARLLKFSPDPVDASDIAWAAEEGEGRPETGDFRARATEVVDLMPNGRFRYAIYDDSGSLAPVADPEHTPAGQPGRCMWCHENHLMTTVRQPDIDGHLAFDDFVEEIGRQQAMVESARRAIGGLVDWETHAVHTWGEVLVEGFLQAPTSRLAAEWSVPTETVESWMAAAGVQPVRNDEYPGWGEVWTRASADAVFALNRGRLPDDHDLAGPSGMRPLSVLPSSRILPEPDAAHPIGLTEFACLPDWSADTGRP
ncbi:MAG: hypothetical protein VX265_12010 [Myxococcota bacterium]|nr:hypothetical protein [Myxococcota bacterium]